MKFRLRLHLWLCPDHVKGSVILPGDREFVTCLTCLYTRPARDPNEF